MPKDKYVGKIVLVDLPGVSGTRHRWIVRKRENGRYTAKAPKIGMRISDLKKLRPADFGKETLLPKAARFRERRGRSRRQVGGSLVPNDYPGLLVTAKPTTGDYDDPDAIPTVMTGKAFLEQVDV